MFVIPPIEADRTTRTNASGDANAPTMMIVEKGAAMLRAAALER
jgi:hypothetical protein